MGNKYKWSSKICKWGISNKFSNIWNSNLYAKWRATAAPTITLSAVINGTTNSYSSGTWTNKNVKLNANIKPNYNTINSVEFTSPNSSYNLQNSDNNYYFVFRSEKTYNLTITVYYFDGIQSKNTNKTFVIKIDKTPPIFENIKFSMRQRCADGVTSCTYAKRVVSGFTCNNTSTINWFILSNTANTVFGHETAPVSCSDLGGSGLSTCGETGADVLNYYNNISTNGKGCSYVAGYRMCIAVYTFGATDVAGNSATYNCNVYVKY